MQLRKRYLRPIIEYLIGNEKNGFIANVAQLEIWENSIPCGNCGVDKCERACVHYAKWLDNPQTKVLLLNGKKVEIDCEWFADESVSIEWANVHCGQCPVRFECFSLLF